MCKGCRETARQIPALQAPPWESSREQSLPHETFVLSRNLVPIQVVCKWEPIRVSSHPDCFFHCSGGRNTHTEWHGVSYCTKWYCVPKWYCDQAVLPALKAENRADFSLHMWWLFCPGLGKLGPVHFICLPALLFRSKQSFSQRKNGMWYLFCNNKQEFFVHILRRNKGQQ